MYVLAHVINVVVVGAEWDRDVTIYLMADLKQNTVGTVKDEKDTIWIHGVENLYD